jgi:DNA primase
VSPRMDADSVREVIDAADLVELVRGRVTLQRRGARWVGRCPFHEERTPSFGLIPPDNRWYYCHGCGAKGNAVDWMIQKEGAAGFPEAVEGLAERFGLTLRYEEASPEEEARRQADRRRLELLERAAGFYAEYLWRADEAAPAREYLTRRGFGEDVVRRFRIGFAPSGGAVLADRARKQGFTRDQLLEAGLGRARGGGVGDFFVGRITFPITDLRGRVMGFGARTLDPNQRAKYVNSPEGPRFQKRRLLFGMPQARQAAARAGHVLVVEGYTDVLAFHLAGVPQVVACMGTSLTSDQVRELRRAAPRIRLCFDGDAAGQNAAWRSAEAAGEHLMDLDAVVLPPGRDPGDMASDGASLAELLRIGQEFESLVTYLVTLRARRAGRSPADREAAFREIADLLRRVPDSVEKDEGVRLATGLLQLSRPMEERLREATMAGAARGAAAPVRTAGLDAETLRERRLLVLAVAAGPDAAREVLTGVTDEVFGEPAHRRAAALLRDGSPLEGWPDDLRELAILLRAEASEGSGTLAELREASYRVQIPALERQAARLRESGDEEGRLRVLDLVRRLRAALRGDE